jgi:hypothetical protein
LYDGAEIRTSKQGGVTVPVEIEAFLKAYGRKCICIPCLCAVTQRAERDVRDVVMILITERRVQTSIDECLNCSVTGHVVRGA